MLDRWNKVAPIGQKVRYSPSRNMSIITHTRSTAFTWFGSQYVYVDDDEEIVPLSKIVRIVNVRRGDK